MLGYVILGVLAAFGFFCMLWAMGGLLLPRKRGGVLVFLCRPGLPADEAVLWDGWLRGLGFLKAPLLLVDSPLSPEQRQKLSSVHPHVEFCSLEELPSRLELERTEFG